MTDTDRIDISPLAERPSFVPRLGEIVETWPAFVPHEPVANALLGLVPETFPDCCVVATDGDRVVARGLSVPFDASADGREEMPSQGWDRVLVWAFQDLRRDRPATIAGALEITVDTEYLGLGLSHRMPAAMRAAVADRGHAVLPAAVRPNAKHLEPHVSMADYVLRQRDDGLPTDPWLRVHVKAGGTIERIAPASMTVSASPAQWHQWTGVPVDHDGDIEVPGALVPVHCNLAHDHAVYVEPNVWVRHTTSTPTT